MTWVRGHYRRPRHGVSAAVVLALLPVAFVGTVVAAVVSVTARIVKPLYDFLGGNWDVLAVAATGIFALVVVVKVRRAVRAKREADALERFWAEAWKLAKNPNATPEQASRVSTLRKQLTVYPAHFNDEFEKFYAEAVSEIVADKAVNATERRRMDSMRRGLGIPDEVASRAELNGFLYAHAALVGDGKLTETEEAQLAHLREALRIPPEAIKAQLQRADELRRTRLVQQRPLQPIDATVKLRKGEACYHMSSFVEHKKRVTRTYQEDGVRHSDTGYEPTRRGVLYVTAARVLLVAEGTTSVKLGSLLEVAVDAEEGLVALTVDGRKTPYYFSVPEPFLTAAYMEKASAAAS